MQHSMPWWIKQRLARALDWLLADPVKAAVSSHAAPQRPHWQVKAVEYLRRYLPLECVSIVTALIGAWLAHLLIGHPIAVAYGGAWGENVGYYGLAYLRELRHAPELDDDPDGEPRHLFARERRVISNLVFEFGLAELIDSFVVRPFCMFVATAALGSLSAGVIAGKLVGDVVFYGLAIVFYEMAKRRQG